MGTKKYLDTFGVIIHIVYPKKEKGHRSLSTA